MTTTSAAFLGGAARQFRVGDVVRNGAHVATVIDVGTVLIAVRTAMGAPRMVCPWELVRLRISRVELGFGAPQR
ncbi:MAG: mechanosensitive ion channel domain-containing protein [Mycobacterium sp.]